MAARRVMQTLAMAALPWLGMTPVQAQDGQTLADIRQELAVLYVEVQRLSRELATTGAPDTAVTGNTALERLSAIEAELQRLTSATEELEYRITRITRDGTNRIGDLEFRLCELEPDCDIASLGDTPTLGGIDAEAALPTPTPQQPAEGPAMAVGEQADFDRARAALDQGDFAGAVAQFRTFAETYPGGPLTVQAHYLRGEAHESLGELTNAARAYLDAFSGAPDGERAPDALFKLGSMLGQLGQTQDACVTLDEVTVRFPGSEASADAMVARQGFGCS